MQFAAFFVCHWQNHKHCFCWTSLTDLNQCCLFKLTHHTPIAKQASNGNCIFGNQTNIASLSNSIVWLHLQALADHIIWLAIHSFHVWQRRRCEPAQCNCQRLGVVSGGNQGSDISLAPQPHSSCLSCWEAQTKAACTGGDDERPCAVQSSANQLRLSQLMKSKADSQPSASSQE